MVKNSKWAAKRQAVLNVFVRFPSEYTEHSWTDEDYALWFDAFVFDKVVGNSKVFDAIKEVSDGSTDILDVFRCRWGLNPTVGLYKVYDDYKGCSVDELMEALEEIFYTYEYIGRQ